MFDYRTKGGSMKISVARLGHIGITVKDIDRTVAFYERYLGLRLTEKFEYEENRIGHGARVQAGAFMRCDTTHHELSIFRMRSDILPAEAPDASHPAIGTHHIAFELSSPEDLKGLYVLMREGGVPIVNCRIGGPGNQPRFYARDPDGILLEFYWGIDQVGWDGMARAYPPIQEIDLLALDFDAFITQREADATAARAAMRA
jgi:catechol 2,3-dioxygenase-like lactoylglutathione lyase family enzyme